MTSYNINSNWLLILLAVIILLIAVLLFSNFINYYNMKNGTCNNISVNTVDIMIWLNLIMSIISFIIFMLIIWHLIKIYDTGAIII